MTLRPALPAQTFKTRLRKWLAAAVPMVFAGFTTCVTLISLSCGSSQTLSTRPATHPATLASVTPLIQPATLTVRVSGLESTAGQLIVYVYDSADGFLKDDRHIVAQMTISDFTLTPAPRFIIPPGRYAIVVIQDLNKNGDLDTNMLGIPTEPWGVSLAAGGSRPRFRAPTFDESTVNCPVGTTEIPVSLR